MSKEASGDKKAAFYGWNKCGNCKQGFTGALELEMKRRFWRRCRSSTSSDYHYSCRYLASCLGIYEEFDAAIQLVNEASHCVGNNMRAFLDLKLYSATLLSMSGRNLEALGLMQAMVPPAKAYADTPELYTRVMMSIVSVLLKLGRNQEAYEMATELVAFTKANYSTEDRNHINATENYAAACAAVGRIEESKSIFEDILATQTRIYGRDHRETQTTRERIDDLQLLH